MQKADLHVHTTASDGMLSPEEVVVWASRKRIKAVAITDHDTVSGIDAAFSEASKNDVEVVPGIEFSAEYEGEEIHILGYYMDYKSQQLHNILNEIHDSRFTRAIRMIEKLNSIGVDITIEQVKKITDDGIIGRPHIARAMIEKGYIDNIKAAFDHYIGKGEIAYIERYKLSCLDAIKLIKELGGVPVLAHPGLISTKVSLSNILNMGIEGIEAYHSKHNEETVSKIIQIAQARKLIVTGGSDCHGIFVNNEPILGNVWVDFKIVEQLRKKSAFKNYI